MKNSIARVALAAVAVMAALTWPVKAAANAPAVGDTTETIAITVNVVNRNWLDVRVYAVSGSGAYARLGTVTSFTTGKFQLPAWLSAANSDLELVALPIGSTQQYSSGPVLVSPGEKIEWQLENHLALSSITVRGS